MDGRLPKLPQEMITGIRFDAYSFEGLIRTCTQWILDKGHCRQVVFANAFTAVLCSGNAKFATVCSQSDLVIADGTSIILVSQTIGKQALCRIPGPDFMHEMIRNGAEHGMRHYFLGSVSQYYLDRLLTVVKGLAPADHPIEADGFCPPFGEWPEDLNTEIIDRINAFKPDIVWVGVGGPKQDMWIAKNKERLACSYAMGVGAAFDFESGRVKRAPKWIRKVGWNGSTVW